MGNLGDFVGDCRKTSSFWGPEVKRLGGREKGRRVDLLCLFTPAA